MLARLGGVEQRADPARVLERRRRHPELAGEARREMTVAREAELERQRAQVAVVLGQPLERRAQAQCLPVPGEREARLGAEDAGEVERRGVEASGRARRAIAARRDRRRSRTWPPPRARGGLRSSARGWLVAERPEARAPTARARRPAPRPRARPRAVRGAGGRAGAGAGRCACRPGRGSPGGGPPRRAVRASPPPARRTPTRRRARGGAPAGSAGRRCRASRGSASPARARGPPAGSAPSAAERRRARGRRSGSSRAMTGRPEGSGTRRPRASAWRAAGSRWPHHL